jgi:eukaryotic-like serine/threonine-protein kinase
MVVTSAIADVGNRLAIELKGIDCRSGSAVTRAETEAPRREDVVRALGAAAVQLRRALGEPAESLAQYDAPLDEATSASPEALELLFLGYRRALARDARGAISNWQRATQVDPSCALAHSALGTFYSNMGEDALAAASARAAFALRDRLTVPARLLVESSYHLGATGDLESACAILSRWVEAFPHDLIARVNFGGCLMTLGEKDRALGQYREAARLRPTPHSYEQWIVASLKAERPDEAAKTMAEALGRGFDTPSLRDLQVRLSSPTSASSTSIPRTRTPKLCAVPPSRCATCWRISASRAI